MLGSKCLGERKEKLNYRIFKRMGEINYDHLIFVVRIIKFILNELFVHKLPHENNRNKLSNDYVHAKA